MVRKCLLYGGLLFLLALLAGVMIGYHAVRSYLRSDDFRVMLSSRAGEALEGKGNFTPFLWDGWSVSTDEFSFVGADGERKFYARDLDGEVDLGAVWDQTYRLENIRLREFEFEGDFREGVTGTGEIDRWEAGPAGFWDDFLPDKLEVAGVDVASLRGVAKTDEGNWGWSNISARLKPGSGSGVYDMELNGGTITTPWPLVEELAVKSAEGRVSGEQLYLLGAELGVLADAEMTAVGEVSLTSGNWQVQSGLSGARVEELVSEDWKQRLMGPIAATFEASGKPGEEVLVSGDLKISDGMLTALPILDRIAAYTNSMRFRRLALAEASLAFQKRGSVLDLRNIVLASEGLVRLEGAMTIEGNLIRRGDFRLGITPGTLSHLPGAETKVFQRGELGLLWTPLTISGTLDAPREDLSKRLIAAAGERMFELLPESGKYALKYSGEVVGESTRRILSQEGIVLGAGKTLYEKATEGIGGATGVDPGEILKKGSDVVEQGTGVAEEGMNTLFDLFGGSKEK